MGQVWTRDDWNSLISRVNSLAENPPSGCSPVATLPLVPERHKWSVADITAVRDKLRAICRDNVFSAETVKWSQEIITEINNAIEAGWCGCAEAPCNDEVDHPISLAITDTSGAGHINYLRLVYGWDDKNHNGIPEEGETYETCASDERNIQSGTIHPYPELNGFQVYDDLVVARVFENEHLSPVRTWDLRRAYWPYTDPGVCPSLPIKLNFYNLVLLLGGELQPNGSIMLWGDPAVGSGVCAIADETYSNFVPWGSYSLHGNCFKFGLDNYTIASGLPGNSLIGHIVCTDPRYLVNLVGLGYPFPYTNDVMQVGTELRTRRTFYPDEFITFTLRAMGNDARVVFGPYDRIFSLKVV